MLMNPKTECDTIAGELNFPRKGEIINGKEVLSAECKLDKGTIFSYEIRFAATTKPKEVVKVLKDFYTTHSLGTTIPRVVKYHDYQIRSKNNNTVISGALHVVPVALQNPGQTLTAVEEFNADYSKMELADPTKKFNTHTYQGFKGPGFRAKLFTFVSYMGENYGYCDDKLLYHRRASLIMPKINITMAVAGAKMFYHTHPKKDEPSLTSPDDYLLYFDMSHKPRHIRNFYTVMDDRMDYFHIVPKNGEKSKGKYLQIDEEKFLKEVDAQIDNIEDIWIEKIPDKDSSKQDGLRYCEGVTRDLVKWMNKKYASYFTIKYECHYKVRKNPPEPTSDDIHLGNEFLIKALNDIKSGEYAWPEFNSQQMPHENYAYWHQMYYVLHGKDYNLNIGMAWMPGDQRRFEHYLKLKIPETEMSYEDALNILNFAYDVARNDSEIRDSGAVQSRMKEITEFLGMPETIAEDLIMLEQLIHTEDPFGETAKTLSGDYYPLILLSNYSIQAIEIMKRVKSGKMNLEVAKLEVYSQLKERTRNELAPFFLEKNKLEWGHNVGINPPITFGRAELYAIFPIKAFEFSEIYTDALAEFGANTYDMKRKFEGEKGGINLRVPTKHGLVSMTIQKSTGKAQIRISSKDYMEAAMEAVNKVGMKLYEFGAEGIDPEDFQVKVASAAMNPAPQVIAISGPSGSGKSTTLRALLKGLPKAKTVPTITTRARRRSDKPGEKTFVKDSEFKQMLDAGELVAARLQRNGHYYGRKRSDFTGAEYIVLDVSLSGMNDIREVFPGTFSVYLEPSESPEYIEKRLLRRGDMSPQEAKARAKLIPSHIKSSQAMDFNIRVKTAQGKFNLAAQEVLNAVPKTNPPLSVIPATRSDTGIPKFLNADTGEDLTSGVYDGIVIEIIDGKWVATVGDPVKDLTSIRGGWVKSRFNVATSDRGMVIERTGRNMYCGKLTSTEPVFLAIDPLRPREPKAYVEIAGRVKFYGEPEFVHATDFQGNSKSEEPGIYYESATVAQPVIIDNPRMDDIEELEKHTTPLSNPHKLTLSQIAKSVHKDNYRGGGAFGSVFTIPGTNLLFKVNQVSDPAFYNKLLKHLKDGSPIAYSTKEAKLYKVDYHIPFEAGQPRFWVRRGETGRDIVMNNIEGNVIKSYVPQKQFKDFKDRRAANMGKTNYYPKKNIIKYYKYIQELSNIPQASVNTLAKQIKHLMSKGIVIDVNSGNLIYNPKTKRVHLIDWFWDATSSGKTVLSGPPFVQIVERVGLAEWSDRMLDYFGNHHEKFPDEFNLVMDLDEKNKDNMIEWLNKVTIAFKRANLTRGKRNIEGTSMGTPREGESYEDFFTRIVKEGNDNRWSDAAFQDGADRFDYALANPMKEGQGKKRGSSSNDGPGANLPRDFEIWAGEDTDRRLIEQSQKVLELFSAWDNTEYNVLVRTFPDSHPVRDTTEIGNGPLDAINHMGLSPFAEDNPYWIFLYKGTTLYLRGASLVNSYTILFEPTIKAIEWGDNEDAIRYLVMHELGHGLGAIDVHNPDRSSTDYDTEGGHGTHCGVETCVMSTTHYRDMDLALKNTRYAQSIEESFCHLCKPEMQQFQKSSRENKARYNPNTDIHILVNGSREGTVKYLKEKSGYGHEIIDEVNNNERVPDRLVQWFVREASEHRMHFPEDTEGLLRNWLWLKKEKGDNEVKEYIINELSIDEPNNPLKFQAGDVNKVYNHFHSDSSNVNIEKYLPENNKYGDDAEILHSDSEWVVIALHTPEVANEYSRLANNSWCVTTLSEARKYAEAGLPYYMVLKASGGQYALLHKETDQFMDVNNRSLKDVPEDLAKILSEVDMNLVVTMVMTRGMIPDPPQEVIDYIATDPESARDYAKSIQMGPWGHKAAKDIIRYRFPEGEKAIATSAEYSYDYAAVIEERFPEGEKAIATEAKWSARYAQYVIEERFPEGEKAIATSAEYSYEYAAYVIQGRFPEGEAAIATDPGSSYAYAQEVINSIELDTAGPRTSFIKPLNGGKPWPPGEAAIATSAEYSYKYAYLLNSSGPNSGPNSWGNSKVGGGSEPWPPGEAAIATSTQWSYRYARDVIQTPWPPGEATIAKSAKWSLKYAEDVVKGRWVKGEPTIAKVPEYRAQYATSIIRYTFAPEWNKLVANTKMNPPYTTKFDFVPGKDYTFDELSDDHGGASSLREDALHHFRSKEEGGYSWPGKAEDATYRAVIIPVDELVEKFGHLKGTPSLQKHIEKYGLNYPSIGNEGNNRRIAMAKLGRDMPHLEVVPARMNPPWQHGESDIHGTGMFATEPIKKGTVVLEDGGDLRRLNHSDTPNIEFEFPDEIIGIALTDIAEGEELLGDYRQLAELTGHPDPSADPEVLFNPSKNPTVRIEESTNPEKKLMAVFTKPNGRTKTVHFGARGMSDYTQHKDPKRKKNYLARHGGMGENWDNPMTAGALSRWILWGKPSLRESFNDFKKKFNIEGVMAVTNTRMNPAAPEDWRHGKMMSEEEDPFAGQFEEDF